MLKTPAALQGVQVVWQRFARTRTAHSILTLPSVRLRCHSAAQGAFTALLRHMDDEAIAEVTSWAAAAGTRRLSGDLTVVCHLALGVCGHQVIPRAMAAFRATLDNGSDDFAAKVAALQAVASLCDASRGAAARTLQPHLRDFAEVRPSVAECKL